MSATHTNLPQALLAQGDTQPDQFTHADHAIHFLPLTKHEKAGNCADAVVPNQPLVDLDIDRHDLGAAQVVGERLQEWLEQSARAAVVAVKIHDDGDASHATPPS